MHEGLLGQLSVSDEDSATEHIESGQVLVRVLVPVPQVTEQLDHSPQAPVIFIISQKYLSSITLELTITSGVTGTRVSFRSCI